MPLDEQRFDTYAEWEANAPSWLASRGERGEAALIDARGRACRDDAEILRADMQGTFPVRWFWPDQLVNALGSEIAANAKARERIAKLERWCGLGPDDGYPREMAEANLEYAARFMDGQRAHVAAVLSDVDRTGGRVAKGGGTTRG